MQIKWLARALTDPLAISNMRLPVHCGHHDTIRRRHRLQHMHQWRHMANSISTISTNISHHRRRHRRRRHTSDARLAIEMEIVASLRSQRHRCPPDRRYTINSNSTSKLASTLTKQCTKRMWRTVAVANVYDIDRIIDVHYFDAFSIICGTRGPASNFHLQLVIFPTFFISFKWEIEKFRVIKFHSKK